MIGGFLMPEIEMEVVPSFEGVSDALARLKAFISDLGCPPDRASEVELACAEALNNVVEHGDPASGNLRLHLNAVVSGDKLSVDVFDNGTPFDAPNAETAKVNLISATDTVAEGGFGWGLIHMLADAVTVTRKNNTNHLNVCFSLPNAQS